MENWDEPALESRLTNLVDPRKPDVRAAGVDMFREPSLRRIGRSGLVPRDDEAPARVADRNARRQRDCF